MTPLHLAALPASPQLTGWLLLGVIILGILAVLFFTGAIANWNKADDLREKFKLKDAEINDLRASLVSTHEDLIATRGVVGTHASNLREIKLALWGKPLLADRTHSEIIDAITTLKNDGCAFARSNSRLREELHALRNQLQPLTLQVELLKREKDNLARENDHLQEILQGYKNGATEAQAVS